MKHLFELIWKFMSEIRRILQLFASSLFSSVSSFNFHLNVFQVFKYYTPAIIFNKGNNYSQVPDLYKREQISLHFI